MDTCLSRTPVTVNTLSALYFLVIRHQKRMTMTFLLLGPSLAMILCVVAGWGKLL